MPYNEKSLSKSFEAAYSEFHNHFVREEDPVRFAHEYPNPRDQETIAFLSAIFAYGNRKQIIKSLQNLFSQLGDSPYQSILSLRGNEKFSFKHRFSTASDLRIILNCLRKFFIKHGSLQNYFESFPKRETVKEILSAFHTDFFLEEPLKSFQDRKRYLDFLVSSPRKGSCCKRLNLFLRWVARPKDNIDLGLWNGFGTERLMLPIDTHLFKMISHLGWTERKTPSWKTVEEATARLRRINSIDPIRYDFSLCHLSMRGNLQTFIAGLNKNAQMDGRPLHQKSQSRKLRSAKRL